MSGGNLEPFYKSHKKNKCTFYQLMTSHVLCLSLTRIIRVSLKIFVSYCGLLCFFLEAIPARLRDHLKVVKMTHEQFVEIQAVKIFSSC